MQYKVASGASLCYNRTYKLNALAVLETPRAVCLLRRHTIDTLPHPKTVRKSFKYRLYPNKEQTAKLEWTLARCCELYNAALQERREAWKYAKKHVTWIDQNYQLPEIRQIRPEYQGIYRAILTETIRQVDRAMQGFFARCKRGNTPGFPRYRSARRFDSFTFPQMEVRKTSHYGPQLQGDRLVLQQIGSVKIKLSRPIEGKIKTVTIKREVDQWYAVFSCVIEVPEQLPECSEQVGIDLGLNHFATLSTGETIENPRYLRKSEKKLEKHQQSLARKKRGSNRRRKVVKTVAKAHRKITRQRRDFLHKESRTLVNRFQTIVFEDLRPVNMSSRPKPKQDEDGNYVPNGAAAKAGLNKSIRDAGWVMFVFMCSYKAGEAGRTVVQVDPRYTSQICSGCGTIVKKELSERWHSCSCGTELDRDHNAALNILRLGRSLQEQS